FLARVVLPEKQAGARGKVAERWPHAVLKPGPCSRLAGDLSRYFRGERVDFGAALLRGAASSFEKRVFKATAEIPWGEVRSYKWVAEKLGDGSAARAVGQSLGRNPWPIIVPCHRVIRSGGGLGGFSLGLDWKRRLLALEGSAVDTVAGGSGGAHFA
ncbi:MAG: methylated-DNA--[protein]-cysteine S-methyltransferase, partial [Terriglobia bacterium]